MTRKRAIRLGIIVVMLIGGTILVASLASPAYTRKLRRDWKNNAIAQIERLSGDPVWLSGQLETIRKQIADARHRDDTWLTSHSAMTRDGQWIVFMSHCGKQGRHISDIFIGKASNGKWYYSTYHFCVDMCAVRIDNQPADLTSFITQYYLREFDGRTDQALEKTWPPR